MTTTASDAGAVLLPDLGEDIEEADVLQIYVSVGDLIAIEQPIVEIETEKATLDLPSPVAGTVTEIHVRPGDTIRPGDPVISVTSTEDAAPATPPVSEPAEPIVIPDAADLPDPDEPPASSAAATEAPPPRNLNQSRCRTPAIIQRRSSACRRPLGLRW